MLRQYKDRGEIMRVLKSLGFLLLAAVLVGIPTASRGQIAVGISVRVGPPVLPVYTQPVCPGPGYIWTPGYWAHNDDDYYWVPGTWVMAPEPGLLWRWHQLWIWLCGRGLLGRRMARKRICLQSLGDQRQRDRDPQLLQQDRGGEQR